MTNIKHGLAARQCLCLILCAPLLLGCRFAQSESQRRSHLAAGPDVVINGQPMTLLAELTRCDLPKKRFDLSGTLTVKAPAGELNGLDAFHFSLRPAKAGYYVQNFRRKQMENGSIWGGPSSRQCFL